MKIYYIYFADTCFDKHFANIQGILFKTILNMNKK